MKSNLFYPIIFSLSLGLTSTQGFADIYKITKPDGSVKYTDKLLTNERDMVDKSIQKNKIERVSLPQEVELSKLMQAANSAIGLQDIQSHYESETKLDSNDHLINDTFVENESNKLKAANYKIKILTPKKVRAYHKPVEVIDVKVNIIPALVGGDKVIVLVDGRQVGLGQTTSIATSEINPGDHILEVNIVTNNGKVIKSATMPFYIIQNSNIMRNKRRQVQ